MHANFNRKRGEGAKEDEPRPRLKRSPPTTFPVLSPPPPVANFVRRNLGGDNLDFPFASPLLLRRPRKFRGDGIGGMDFRTTMTGLMRSTDVFRPYLWSCSRYDYANAYLSSAEHPGQLGSRGRRMLHVYIYINERISRYLKIIELDRANVALSSKRWLEE